MSQRAITVRVRRRMIGAMKGPPITISCECGQTRLVPYGETWVCEECSRRWNTGQIPEADYESLLRRVRRYRLEILGLAFAVLAVFVPLIVFVNQKFVFVAAVAAFAWMFLYMPFWRRRVRRAAREAPTWNLRAE
jgi:hypothetical protein